MSTPLIQPIEALGSAAQIDPTMLQPHGTRATTSFANMLTDGVEQLMSKVEDADRLTRAFIVDDNIPVHQVTFALEQARLSMELMMQVRGRLLEGYQQLMNMQL